MVDKMNAKAYDLKPLAVGDQVHIQNQYGNHPTRWDKTGIVMQVGEHDKYMVRVHGSRRVTARNRRFLRKFFPLGEKMVEEPRVISPMREHSDNTAKEPTFTPPDKPAPVIPEALPDTPKPPQMSIHDTTECPTGVESPTFTEGDAKDNVIPEPAPVEPPTLRRSTREKKRPDYYGQWVEETK